MISFNRSEKQDHTTRKCRQGILLFAVVPLFLLTCSKEEETQAIDYRQEMRDFVTGISSYGRTLNPDCIIIPQNGIQLITDNGETDGNMVSDYMAAFNGIGQEELNFGYPGDDIPTPVEESAYLKGFLDLASSVGKMILVTDYCLTQSKMDSAFAWNERSGYLSFSADHRELNDIPAYPPAIRHENNNDILNLGDARNFLYLINMESFSSRDEFVRKVSATNYDVIILDLFFQDGSQFLESEIESLKTKTSGARRLVICYLSIGEAESYRYYWQPSWKQGTPSWLDQENPDWEGNFKVKYWDTEWKSIIYGNDASYVKKILDVGFDGLYLDIIDAFEYFEESAD